MPHQDAGATGHAWAFWCMRGPSGASLKPAAQTPRNAPMVSATVNNCAAGSAQVMVRPSTTLRAITCSNHPPHTSTSSPGRSTGSSEHPERTIEIERAIKAGHEVGTQVNGSSGSAPSAVPTAHRLLTASEHAWRWLLPFPLQQLHLYLSNGRNPRRTRRVLVFHPPDLTD